MTEPRTIDSPGNQQGLAPDWLSQVRIRTAVKQDLPAMEWDGQFAHFRQIYAEVYERARHNLALIWLVEIPPVGLIGQALVQLNTFGQQGGANGRSRAYVHSFRVRPGYRQAGLGSKLMIVVETDLLERGFQEVTLNVAQQNPGALRLYQRLGYRKVGTDPGRWSYVDEKEEVHNIEQPGFRMLKTLR